MDDKAVEQQPQVRAAREALAEAQKGTYVVKHYAQVVSQVPMLLHHHGLGQTLACLRLRAAGSSTSPYELVARQLDRWLVQALGSSARGAIAALAAQDSRYYREASRQAWLFVRALRACLEESS